MSERIDKALSTKKTNKKKKNQENTNKCHPKFPHDMVALIDSTFGKF